MTNPYYESGSVNALSRARASIVNAEFGKIELAFDGLHESLNDFGTATSASAITLGTGVKALTIVGGHFIQVGQQVAVSSAVMPITHYMIGVVTDYDTGTGEAEVTVSNFEGTGTLSNWVVSITPRGFFTAIQGLTGVQTMDAIKAGLDLAGVTSALVASLAPLASPALTNTPTAPTASRSDDTTQLATTAYVQSNVGWTQIATANASGLSQVTFTSIPNHYKNLLVVGDPIGADAATPLLFDISSDGVNFGSSELSNLSETLVDSAAMWLPHARGTVAPVLVGLGQTVGSSQLFTTPGSYTSTLRRCSGGIFAIRAKVGSPRVFKIGSTFVLYGN